MDTQVTARPHERVLVSRRVNELPQWTQDLLLALANDGCCQGTGTGSNRTYVVSFVNGRMVVMRGKQIE